MAQQTGTAVAELLAGGTLAGDWTLDPARSQVRLHTRHTWGLRLLHGAFRQVSGSGTITADGAVSGVVTVAAASVDTKNRQRDKHLRSADFFDAENHPDFVFTVDSVQPAGAGVRVAGRLTVRERSLPVVFDAAVSAADKEVSLDGEFGVNRTEFGMTWNLLGIAALDSTIGVHAVFTRS